MTEYANFDSVPVNLRAQICREMFPQPSAAHQNLDYCMRFLPHHNDDGGFFVAILRKTREINWTVKSFEEQQRRKLQTPKFINKPQVISNHPFQNSIQYYFYGTSCIFSSSIK
jgi:tRNA (cytosine34-C5)-methyltransferase